MDGPRQTSIGEFKAAVREQLVSAMGELGDVITAGLRDDLSDSYPPAGPPGGNPHSRTGALLAGIHHEVSTSADGVTLTILSSRAGGDPRVPQFLNAGTARMRARPYMSNSFIEWSGKFEVISEVAREHLSNVTNG